MFKVSYSFLAALLFSLITTMSYQNVSAQTVILQDNLQGSTIGTQVGGSFSSEGYKPGLSNSGKNHIEYTSPQQIPNGYIEFEVKGHHPSDLPDLGSHQGFFLFYDGRGLPNPPSWEQFQYNYFRRQITGRGTGSFKGFISCAEPTPERINSTYAVFNDHNGSGGLDEEDRDWYSETGSSVFPWDASKTTWYTMKIEWYNKQFKMYINGSMWHQNDAGPYDFDPVNFKIWVGSAAVSGTERFTNKSADIVYRNFRLVSYGASQNSAPTIFSTAITSGVVGQLYSYNVNAVGTPIPTYSLTTFPTGMTINSTTGLIQWTPLSTGNFNVTVTAANGVSPDATQSFTIAVTNQSQNTAPTITSAAVTKGFAGQLYSYDVNATGVPTPTFSLTTSPSGMTINSSSGLIQWTPGSPGNFNVVVKAANGVSPDATQSFTINVAAASPCPAGMISYWKLDENSGSIFYDNFGTNDATSTNAPTPVAGRVSGAQQFDGFSNTITAPRMNEYDFSVSTSFSFEAWINHPAGAFDLEEVVIGRKDAGSLSIRLGFSSTSITFSARSITNESHSVTGTTNLYDGNWHHVVGVRDAGLNQLRIYVDGVLQNTAPATYSSGFTSPTANLNIGWREIPGSENYFKGKIDEVAIYNSALDASAVLKNYNNGLVNLGYCDSQNSPTITSNAVTKAFLGQLYAYDVYAIGNPSPTYSLTNFPSGMTINSTSGLIQWTPTTTGNFSVSVKAANGISPDATQSFTVNATEQPQCPAGMISYWKLDETSGNVYSDFYGTNNATSADTPTPIAGRVGGAQQFNGTSDKIAAPRIAAYDFSASTSFTFEAWIKHPVGSFISQEIILERKTTSSMYISLKFDGSTLLKFQVRNDSDQSYSVSGTINLYDGNWHHIVGVRDASLNQIRIYVDGVLRNTVSAVFTAGFTSSTAGIGIGCRNTPFDPYLSYFNGIIDEVAIYGIAINAATILKNYNNGLINLSYCETLTAPLITSTAVTNGLLGQLYSYDVNATGTPAPKYSLNTFPNGMTIDSVTGLIQWTPDSAGNFNVIVKAANGVSPDTTQSFTITVTDPSLTAPTITSTAVTNGFLGELYSYDVNATGKPTPTYSLTTFPSGMTIDSISGLIEWTPSSTGNFNVSVKATNGINPDTTQSFTINVVQFIAAPSNLLAFSSPADSHDVKLMWNDNSLNEFGFAVERKTGDSLSAAPFSVIHVTAANVTFYEDTSALGSTTYTYRVKAFDPLNGGSSNYSNLAQVTTPVPVEFTSFVANVTSGRINLDWETATEINNSGFSVQRSKDNTKFTDVAFVNGNGTTTTPSSYSYLDKFVLSGKYFYRLKQVDFSGSVTYSKSVEVDLGLPKDYALEQNYPNPFNPSTTIRFALPMNAKVSLKVYNTLGQEVASVLNADLEAGIHETVFNASALSSGVYFYSLKVQGTNGSNFTSTKRMILMK